MRKSLVALLGLFAFTLAAHADIYPGNYSTQVQGALGNSPTYYVNGFANVPGYGVVPFSTGLTATTAYFNFGTQKYDVDRPQFDLTGVLFVGNRVADTILGFTLDPSSTIAGIVATTYILQAGPNSYTYIDFDFSNVTYTAGSHATIDFLFTSAQTPEPSSLLLLATAGGVLGGAVRHGRKP